MSAHFGDCAAAVIGVIYNLLRNKIDLENNSDDWSLFCTFLKSVCLRLARIFQWIPLIEEEIIAKAWCGPLHLG
jgi:hypothetical protein